MPRGLLIASLLALLGCRPAPAPTPAPTPAVLRILSGSPVTAEDVDPHVPFDEVASSVLANVYDGLVGLDASLRPQPRLALRWENPDERTWRFTLDPSARFSDGQPLRAADVKASFERARSLADGNIAGMLRLVTAVEVIDDLTLDLKTERPAALLQDLALVYVARPGREAVPGLAGPPLLGTGPFRVTSFVAGQALTFAPNPHHRRPPRWASVELRVTKGASFHEELARERPDLGVFFSYRDVEQLRARPPAGLRLEQAPGLFVVYLALNQRERVEGLPGRNPLADARVRQALSLALDRAAVASEALAGTARPTSQMTVPAVFGHDASLPPPRESLAEARRLLAQAGQARLELEMLRSRGGSGRTEAAVARAWARAGVSLRERVVDDVSAEAAAGRFQVVVQGYGCSTGDGGEALGFLFHSRQGNEWGAFNYGGYRQPEVDRLTERSLASLDPVQRLDLLRRALRRVSEDYPVLPLVARDDLYVVSERLRLQARPDGLLFFDELAPAGN